MDVRSHRFAQSARDFRIRLYSPGMDSVAQPVGGKEAQRKIRAASSRMLLTAWGPRDRLPLSCSTLGRDGVSETREFQTPKVSENLGLDSLGKSNSESEDLGGRRTLTAYIDTYLVRPATILTLTNCRITK